MGNPAKRFRGSPAFSASPGLSDTGEKMTIEHTGSQYKKVGHFLFNWLTYTMSPSKDDQEKADGLAPSFDNQEKAECMASSISSHISRYCWPEARRLATEWKAILSLRREYESADKKRRVTLHQQITTETHSLILSFTKMHNAIINFDADEWSKRLQKNQIMSHFNITRYQVDEYEEQGLIRGKAKLGWQYHLSLDHILIENKT